MLIVHASEDPKVPGRQIYGIGCAFDAVVPRVDPCKYQLVYVTDERFKDVHGFNLVGSHAGDALAGKVLTAENGSRLQLANQFKLLRA